jgi:hypothetical protein
MPNSLLPIGDTDFWWLRYGLGIAAPIPLSVWGVYSIVTQHSYTYGRRIGIIPVHGEQAVLIGLACIGFALILFSNCYAQFHKTMGFFYQWILALGVLLGGGGILWCNALFLFR